MRCPVTKKITQTELDEMKSVFGDMTYGLIRDNNGFHLQYTRDGSNSILFKDLLSTVSSRKKALILKSEIYIDDFDIEPSMEELFYNIMSKDMTSNTKLKSQSLSTIDIKNALTDRIVSQVKNLAVNDKIGTKDSSNVVILKGSFENAMKIRMAINNYYNDEIISLENIDNKHTKLFINPSDTLVENYQNTNKTDIPEKQNDTRDLSDYGSTYLLTAPPVSISHSKIENVIKSRNKMLSKLIDDISVLKTKVKYKPSSQLQRKIQDLQSRINSIKKEIGILKKQIKKEEHSVVSIINALSIRDFNRIDKLLTDKSDPKNLEEAAIITDFLIRLGNLDNSNPLLFGSENIMLSSEESSALAEIRFRADYYKKVIEKYFTDLAIKELENHRNFKKLYPSGNISLKDIIENKGDIDALSALFLGLGLDFKGRDSILSSVIMHMTSKIINKKEQYVSLIIEKLDSVDKSVKDALISIGSYHRLFGKKIPSYNIFYAKNKDGGTTPYLISKLSVEWSSFKSSLKGLIDDSIDKLIKNNEPELIDAVYSAKHRKVMSNAIYLNPKALLELTDDSDLEYIFKLENQFGVINNIDTTDTTNSYYDSINKYGAELWEESVDEQKSMATTWFYTLSKKIYDIKQQLLTDGLLNENDDVDSNNILFIKQNEDAYNELLDFYYKNSPFLTNMANDNGVITANINGNDRMFIVRGTYNVMLPKTDISEYFDNEYDKLMNSEHGDIFLQFLNYAKEASLYINSVIDDPNKKLTKSSILEFNKGVIETLASSLPLKQKFIQFANLTKTNFLKSFLEVFNSKDVEEMYPYTVTINEKPSKSKFKSVTKKAMDEADILTKSIEGANKDGNAVTFIKGIAFNITSKKIFSNYFGLDGTDSGISEFISNNTTNTDNRKLNEILYYLILKNQMEHQTMDLPKTLRYFLKEAAYYDARTELIPQITIMKNIYDNIEHNGKKRETAINKMRQWFNKNILGIHKMKGIPLKWKIYRPGEKKKLNFYNEIAPFLDNKTNNKVRNTKKSFGVNMNVSILGLIWITYQMYKSLGFSPIAGFFNRVNGHFGNKLSDILGDAWTPGNYHKAFNFLTSKSIKEITDILASVTNMKNPENLLLSKGLKKKYKEIQKIQLFMYKSYIIADMRNERQKATQSPDRETFDNFIDPLYLAITRPEWKIQTAPVLAVMMDIDIEDKNHNKIKLFDGKEFKAFDIVDNKLVLKEDFRTPKNIKNWERMTGDTFFGLKSTTIAANKRSQGDYTSLGGMAIKNTVLGKTSMNFMTFLPMFFYFRFGKGKNLELGTNREHSVYELASNMGTGSIAAVVTGLAIVGAGTTFLGAAAGIGAAVGMAAKFYINDEKVTIKSFVDEGRLLLSTLLSLTSKVTGLAVNPAFRKVHGLMGGDTKGEYVDIKVDTINQKLGGEPLSDEESKTIQFVLYELGIVLGMMMLKAATVYSLREEECTEQQKKIFSKKCAKIAIKNQVANYLNNSYMRIMGDIMSWNVVNINSSLRDGSMLRFLDNVGTLLTRAADPESDIIKTGDNIGLSKSNLMLERLLLPSMYSSTRANLKYDWTSSSMPGRNTKWIDDMFKPEFEKSKIKYKSEKSKYRRYLIDKGFTYGESLKKANEVYTLKFDSKKLSEEDKKFMVKMVNAGKYDSKRKEKIFEMENKKK